MSLTSFKPSGGESLQLPNYLTDKRRSADLLTASMTAPGHAAPALATLPRSKSQMSNGRFGQLSFNSFFARHNPHPGRVRHIKGLLDVPICAVNDGGYICTARKTTPTHFPPNETDQRKVKSFEKYGRNVQHVPCNVANANAQRWPIDTINGLQYFMGKPLNMRIYREKAHAHSGIGHADEQQWRQELRALTEAIGLARSDVTGRLVSNSGAPAPPGPPVTADYTAAERRPRTSEYSKETGRLLPATPLRSRQGSRQASRQMSRAGRDALGVDFEMEDMVMQMLCQILQTDDLSAVQSWLLTAVDREKNAVLDMIKAAVSSRDEYYTKHQQVNYEPEEFAKLPAYGQISQPRPATSDQRINSGTKRVINRIDRLTLESPKPPSPGINQVQPDQFLTTSKHVQHPNDIAEIFDASRPADEIPPSSPNKMADTWRPSTSHVA